VKTVVPDNSVLLAAYLPGEPYREAAQTVLRAFSEGRLRLVVPALTPYEFLNGLSKGVRGLRPGVRLSRDEAFSILKAFLRFAVEAVPVDGMEEDVLDVSVRHERTAYDAAYLVLARRLRAELVTADDRLFRAMAAAFPYTRHVTDLARELSPGSPPE